MSAIANTHNKLFNACPFNILGEESLRQRKHALSQHGHTGIVQELRSPDGIALGYYNLRSEKGGSVVFSNQQPFLQLSYTISGSKSYHVNSGKTVLANMGKQQYNYLFFPQQEIQLSWEPNEPLEIFELGVSPELLFNFMPEEHPLFDVFRKSLVDNSPVPLSKNNLPLQANFSTILYEMLNCPLEGRYKQLYIKAKTIELLAIQLTHYEQMMGVPAREPAARTLKKEDIEKMYLARDIIIQNINSPCTLIDLSHRVGTNDAYLKSHFKQVFGTTVYGYLQNIKMAHAREMLAEGKSVSEVAYLSGYKHTAHFTRAFKKHFGFAPGIMKR
ncbi:AraC-type DNA-binding protein [Chitinophaga terrae (ex Kim and Jung 2007)]|uniref:AraC-type DNA-binding protein n=1 Tax=Chitinophaga terrae (ex Kim and Jung 2007) TaxID=408074 RepID=A0A1H4GGZ6_9BACT|nr:AraC family transcriptional regulator [Chitinophaga terrae (ex Kim and Jung 2007)]MDQ0110036.1 AraC-like DNA-binding protein [Chitinophaga terrae (ex Kim and Jung 2007)]GEP93350.1 AraC family transcriptional regulator [Chitinophaga terrae (ex Kim and Jung 2007)]SEB08148.1 AraC-type DNA-binding protein [Chitinophaga terrae (ex Kim and Jung 2007)]